jgi:hypothetical protein
VLVLLWPHWLALFCGSFLFLAWGALSLPTTFAVVAASLDRRRHTMGIGVQSLVASASASRTRSSFSGR